MTKQNHHNQFEEAIEAIERIIEGIEPGMTIRISDIAAQVNMVKMDSAVKSATIMLLKKYGIKCAKEGE